MCSQKRPHWQTAKRLSPFVLTFHSPVILVSKGFSLNRVESLRFSMLLTNAVKLPNPPLFYSAVIQQPLLAFYKKVFLTLQPKISSSWFFPRPKLLILILQHLLNYRIFSCISRPFTTNKSAQKIALDLYTSHTQRPDQAVREISITTAWSA